MADKKDKPTVEVEKKKTPRAATKKPAEAKADAASAAAEASEKKVAPRRAGKVTGIADISAAMQPAASPKA